MTGDVFKRQEVQHRHDVQPGLGPGCHVSDMRSRSQIPILSDTTYYCGRSYRFGESTIDNSRSSEYSLIKNGMTIVEKYNGQHGYPIKAELSL